MLSHHHRNMFVAKKDAREFMFFLSFLFSRLTSLFVICYHTSLNPLNLTSLFVTCLYVKYEARASYLSLSSRLEAG